MTPLGILSEEPKSLVEAFAEPAEAKGSDVVSLEIVSVQSSQQSAEQTSVSQGKQKILIFKVFHNMYSLVPIRRQVPINSHASRQ